MPTTTSYGGITIVISDDGGTEVFYANGSRSFTSADGNLRIDVNADGTDWTITTGGDSFSFRWEEGSDSGVDDTDPPDPPEPEDPPEPPGPEDPEERPTTDDEGGKNDVGWRPKFDGGTDPKDPMDVSDVGTVIRIQGGGEPPGDPWDKDDDKTRRIKLHGEGTVIIDPWEKIGPKFRPFYRVNSTKNGSANYTFNTTGLLRFMSSIIRLTKERPTANDKLPRTNL